MDLRSAKPSESFYFGILDENLFTVFTRAKLQGEAERFAELGYDSKYFVIDTSELLKADILTRYQAYQIGLAANFIQPDEIRFKENLAPLGLDFIKLGLNDVLYDPKKKQIYTPNTDSHAKIDDAGLQSGGEGGIIAEKRENPYHAKDGKFTNAPGGKIKSVTVSDDGTVTTVYKAQAKTKYAPSPQRKCEGIQVSPRKYGKLCGTFNSKYPNAPKGAKGVIYDGKYMYRAKYNGEGGNVISHKRILK